MVLKVVGALKAVGALKVVGNQSCTPSAFHIWEHLNPHTGTARPLRQVPLDYARDRQGRLLRACLELFATRLLAAVCWQPTGTDGIPKTQSFICDALYIHCTAYCTVNCYPSQVDIVWPYIHP